MRCAATGKWRRCGKQLQFRPRPGAGSKGLKQVIGSNRLRPKRHAAPGSMTRRGRDILLGPQPFTGTVTGLDNLKVNSVLTGSVELSFFCFSLFLSLDLAEAVLTLTLSDGRRELVSRS
jgi:hypothetical protein